MSWYRPRSWSLSLKIPVAHTVMIVGAVIGFAIGSPFEGWVQAMFPLLGAATGLGLWGVLEGPLATWRRG